MSENDLLKTTPARRKANKKYNQNHYKSITYQAKIDDYAQIKAYADAQNISISKLCKLCVKYCLSHDALELDRREAEGEPEQNPQECI